MVVTLLENNIINYSDLDTIGYDELVKIYLAYGMYRDEINKMWEVDK